MSLSSIRIRNVLVLLSAWLFMQAEVLRHEYSADHLASSSHHYCIANVVKLDDFDDVINEVKTTPLVIEAATQVKFERRLLPFSLQLLRHSRAPPFNINV